MSDILATRGASFEAADIQIRSGPGAVYIRLVDKPAIALGEMTTAQAFAVARILRSAAQRSLCDQSSISLPTFTEYRVDIR